jgi:hypothetical protein
MKYSVKEQIDLKAVVVEASGIINTDLAESMVMDAGKALRVSGYEKCFFDLVETEVDPKQTLTEMFVFIEIFKKAGIDRSTRIAALYVSGGAHRSQLEEGAKFEDFNLRHFTDRNKALKWLNQS